MKLSDIAEKLEANLIGDGNIDISGVAPIEEAGVGDITFLANTKYTKYLTELKASAILVPPEVNKAGGSAILQIGNPYYAFLQIVSLFHPAEPLIEKGIHPTALFGEGTTLGTDLSVGAQVIIGRNCRIGDRTVILPCAVIGDEVMVGEDCLIHANVCLREKVSIGNRVVLQNNVVIGSDGFGFAPDAGIFHKIPQVGTVVIEDDVEIGANTTIDRATMGETLIKKGAKLDNLIQVAHNCTIGENTVIAAQTGLSGSTHIGNNVRIGGQVGFAGHLEVGDNAAIGAQSGISKSIPSGEFWFGYPAQPARNEFRIQAILRKLPGILKEIKGLKDRIMKLEKD